MSMNLDIPGLIYCEDYISVDDQEIVLTELDKLPWNKSLSRRVQQYGYEYDYTKKSLATKKIGPMPNFLSAIAHDLHRANLMPEVPDQAIINEYMPGQGIAPHIDCLPCFKDTIATISLGSVYTMNLTEFKTQRKENIKLELGSCLILSGEARYNWLHGIMPLKSEGGILRGRRVSLTFRNVIL